MAHGVLRNVPSEWWKSFFDSDYQRLWGAYIPEHRSRTEADALWQMLSLTTGSRVLDAPCGFGRLSRPLAEKGAVVLGVDQSEEMIATAVRDRGDVSAEQLRYLRHDLRVPLEEGGFDVAINVFSSLGYGTEDEDVAILTTLRTAVRPGGLVLVETAHRDLAVVRLARADKIGSRLEDGTLVVEEPHFDPITGRVETAWHWFGVSGHGSKPASFRMYSATELINLIGRAGLRFRAAYNGCTSEPFKIDGRLGLLAER